MWSLILLVKVEAGAKGIRTGRSVVSLTSSATRGRQNRTVSGRRVRKRG